jgi:hypothetical protein
MMGPKTIPSKTTGLDAALDSLVDNGIVQTRARAPRRTGAGDVDGRVLLEGIYKALQLS